MPHCVLRDRARRPHCDETPQARRELTPIRGGTRRPGDEQDRVRAPWRSAAASGRKRNRSVATGGSNGLGCRSLAAGNNGCFAANADLLRRSAHRLPRAALLSHSEQVDAWKTTMFTCQVSQVHGNPEVPRPHSLSQAFLIPSKLSCFHSSFQSW